MRAAQDDSSNASTETFTNYRTGLVAKELLGVPGANPAYSDVRSRWSANAEHWNKQWIMNCCMQIDSTISENLTAPKNRR
jgi:hypothetical protein